MEQEEWEPAKLRLPNGGRKGMGRAKAGMKWATPTTRHNLNTTSGGVSVSWFGQRGETK